jgi:hypothetical protein
MVSTLTNQLDSQGRVINTWADIINRADLGMEVMHERNAHNFPLDLASGEVLPVALTAPSINRTWAAWRRFSTSWRVARRSASARASTAAEA